MRRGRKSRPNALNSHAENPLLAPSRCFGSFHRREQALPAVQKSGRASVGLSEVVAVHHRRRRLPQIHDFVLIWLCLPWIMESKPWLSYRSQNLEQSRCSSPGSRSTKQHSSACLALGCLFPNTMSRLEDALPRPEIRACPQPAKDRVEQLRWLCPALTRQAVADQTILQKLIRKTELSRIDKLGRNVSTSAAQIYGSWHGRLRSRLDAWRPVHEGVAGTPTTKPVASDIRCQPCQPDSWSPCVTVYVACSETPSRSSLVPVFGKLSKGMSKNCRQN